METSIATLIILTVVLFGVLTMTQVYLSAQDTILESWREMEERLGDRARTQISAVGAETKDLGFTVEVTLRNEGDTKLADFDQWDVILQYNGADSEEHVEWCQYASGTGCWWSKGVISGDFEPGILNPDEQVQITIIPTEEITPAGRAIIATPNGISTSKDFTR